MFRDLIFSFLIIFSTIFRRLNRDKIRVLAYHEIPNLKAFEKQLRWLKSNFNILDLDTFEQCVAGKQKFPKNSLLITFDDGDYTMLSGGELLKKLDIPAVVFVITGIIDTQKPFWWRELRQYLGEEEGKTKGRQLKQVLNEERVRFLNNLRNQQNEQLIQAQLTTADLYQLEQNGVRVANHSHTHPMFNRVTAEELLQEMKSTEDFFKNKNLSGYPYVAYPNGNFDPETEKIMEASGIRLGFLFDHQWNHPNQIHPLRISRIRTNTYDALPEFKVKVSGLHSKLMKS
ncbi:MAG: polysaccharide deacetylase family protein [Flavobacterium sp.]